MKKEINNLHESIGLSDSQVVETILSFYSIEDDKVDGSNSHRQIDSMRAYDEKNLVSIDAIEPYTAAWVGLMLAQGAISWVGGKIMDKIFGSSSELKIDLASLIKSVLLGVSKIIKHEITIEALNRSEADLSALQMRFRHYNNAPSLDRLSVATESSENLSSQFKRFELFGHHSFLVTVGIHIAVLQERIKHFGDSEKINLKEVLEQSIKHTELMQENWKNWNRNNYRINEIGVGPSFLRVYIYEIIDTRNSHKLWHSEIYGKQVPISHFNAILEKFIAVGLTKTIKEHISPSEEVVDKWKELLGTIL